MRIRADHERGHAPSVLETHVDAIGILDDVAVRQHETVRCNDKAAASAMELIQAPPLQLFWSTACHADAYDCRTDLLDCADDCARICVERVALVAGCQLIVHEFLANWGGYIIRPGVTPDNLYLWPGRLRLLLLGGDRQRGVGMHVRQRALSAHVLVHSSRHESVVTAAGFRICYH